MQPGGGNVPSGGIIGSKRRNRAPVLKTVRLLKMGLLDGVAKQDRGGGGGCAERRLVVCAWQLAAAAVLPCNLRLYVPDPLVASLALAGRQAAAARYSSSSSRWARQQCSSCAINAVLCSRARRILYEILVPTACCAQMEPTLPSSGRAPRARPAHLLALAQQLLEGLLLELLLLLAGPLAALRASLHPQQRCRLLGCPGSLPGPGACASAVRAELGAKRVGCQARRNNGEQSSAAHAAAHANPEAAARMRSAHLQVEGHDVQCQLWTVAAGCGHDAQDVGSRGCRRPPELRNSLAEASVQCRRPAHAGWLACAANR